MILKNLWRRKTRTLLTLLGIAIGVAAVVSLSAFAEGFANNFGQTLSPSEADLTVGQKSAVMLFLSAVDQDVGLELKRMPGVDQVAGTVFGVAQMRDAPYFLVMGQDLGSFVMGHYRLIAGQLPAGRMQILIGKTTAENFKKNPGDVFRLNDMTYRVSGIYETGVSLEDGGALMRLADAQRAFDKRNQVSYFSLKVKDARHLDSLKQQIEARWPELAATRSGEATQQTEALNLYSSFGWFVGMFAVLVGGLGMMNTTLMSVFERTREIGVLRAVGWSRWRVLRLIMGESLALALAGGGLGLLLGIGLIEAVKLLPAVESLLATTLTPRLLVQAMSIALLLGVVGGLYPAWRAAQLAPAEAMRAESGATTRVSRLARFFGRGALRNLWRRPARTLITLSGLGIGVGFIVALMAVTEGFIVAFDQIAGVGQVDLLAEKANTSDISLSVIEERTALRVRARPEVAAISKIILGVTSAPGLPYFMVFGVDPAEDYIRHYRVREGRLIQGSGEVMVGRFAANSLKKHVGDLLLVSGRRYQVVGVYENGSAYEDASGVLVLRDAQTLFNKPHKMSLLGIKLKPAYQGQADAVVRQLKAAFPDLTLSQSTEFAQQLQEMATTYVMLGALIVLTIVVGGVVMMNAMLMSVFERTQEIGVLRALGWRRWQVMGMVAAESLAVSLLSAGLGIGLGMGLAALFQLEPTLGVYLTPAYSPRLFVQVLALAVTLGAIGGLYPAWRAAGLRPIEALRYE